MVSEVDDTLQYCVLSSHTHNHFMAIFLGPPRWVGARRNSGLLWCKRRYQRHTHRPSGYPWHPPFLCRMSFLQQPSHFILSWDRHQICWLPFPVAWITHLVTIIMGEFHCVSVTSQFCSLGVSVLGVCEVDLQSTTTTTTTVLRPFVRDYPGEPVPAETFTHPPSWSSSKLYQLLPSATIHSILLVQITCLAIFLYNLSMSSLVYLLVWSPPPHIPYISSPNHCLLFATHAHIVATCFAVVSILYHLFLVFLSTPYLELCLLP